MKPLAIADYLDHLGGAPAESAVARREPSPFRPRSLPAPQGGEQRLRPVFDRPSNASGAGSQQGENRSRRTPWDKAPVPLSPAVRQVQAATETANSGDEAAKLADAHARGRGEGRAEALERLAAEVADARRQALAERRELEVNEYARLEAEVRSGFARIEENVGAAVARILTPFMAKQVVKYVTDELCKNIARLCAGRSPGLITIRGPERILSLVRERVAGLSAKIEYVEDNGVEALVEAGATQITTELQSWAELLASLDA